MAIAKKASVSIAHMCFGGHVLAFLQGRYLGVGLLVFGVSSVCLGLINNLPNSFPTVPFCMSTSGVNIPVSPPLYPCQLLVMSVFSFY